MESLESIDEDIAQLLEGLLPTKFAKDTDDLFGLVFRTIPPRSF